MSLSLLWVACLSPSTGESQIVDPESSVDLMLTLDGQPHELPYIWASVVRVEPTDGCMPSSRLLLHNANTAASLRLEAVFPDPFVTGVVSTLASLPFDGDHLPTMTLDKGALQGGPSQWVATHGGQVTFVADEAWSTFELLFEGTTLCPGGTLEDLSRLETADCSSAELTMTMTGAMGQGYCAEGSGGEGALCAPPSHLDAEEWPCEAGPATNEE
jgi:hypothetical protein